MRRSMTLLENCTREKRDPYVRTPAQSLSERPVSHRTYSSAFYQTTDSYSFRASAPNTYRLFVGIDSITQKRPNVTPHQNEPLHGSRPTSQGTVSPLRGFPLVTRKGPGGPSLWSVREKGFHRGEGNRNPSPLWSLFRPFLASQKGTRRRQQEAVTNKIKSIGEFVTIPAYLTPLFLFHPLPHSLQHILLHTQPSLIRSRPNRRSLLFGGPNHNVIPALVILNTRPLLRICNRHSYLLSQMKKATLHQILCPSGNTNSQINSAPSASAMRSKSSELHFPVFKR